ncbi:ATP-binding cassette domain-containing protein [uncultured Lutibacter sp.]|uniref:ATP-binding cassette domain-containing protein n=1 Tax=uncultured Lutibacter sp. TaxID=437739 RepID=UPI00260B3B6C|nr:ATP-binding cassette domain-containing protein [uncultured Lutibacter sp.]
MQLYNHYAIYDSGLSIKSLFINNLLKGLAPKPFDHFKGKKGLYFSNFTLKSFLKEEVLHNDYSLSKNEKRSIRTFSSGEQKKALLKYLLSKNPDFLILENVFDMLDKESRASLLIELGEISKKTPIIQLFKRKSELLPFISTILHIENEEILFIGSANEFEFKFKKEQLKEVNARIPKPLNKFEVVENPLIQFKNVSVKYNGRTILNDVNWKIKKGEFWQLMGPNGSGKTTLLTMLIGDNPKAYGEDITIFGVKKGSGESVWEIKKKIGYVTPAMTELFKGRHSVENMIISGLYDSIGLYQPPTTTEKKLASEWIELIGLNGFKQTWFRRLTEEQQCLVLIARSMIKHPPLLILDEPSSGLNDYNIAFLTNLINKMAKETSTAIIYVSHKKEKGLNPSHIFELVPSKNGSIGLVK